MSYHLVIRLLYMTITQYVYKYIFIDFCLYCKQGNKEFLEFHRSLNTQDSLLNWLTVGSLPGVQCTF